LGAAISSIYSKLDLTSGPSLLSRRHLRVQAADQNKPYNETLPAVVELSGQPGPPPAAQTQAEIGQI